MRFSATAAGCTVADSADSNAPATARACPAAPATRAADALNQRECGVAAATIARAAASCQPSPAGAGVTEPNAEGAVPSSRAKPSQAAAACSIGAEPAPARISVELISGGNTKKLIAVAAFPTGIGHSTPREQPMVGVIRDAGQFG